MSKTIDTENKGATEVPEEDRMTAYLNCAKKNKNIYGTQQITCTCKTKGVYPFRVAKNTIEKLKEPIEALAELRDVL